MPAVAIRQMDGLTKVVAYTRTDAQRRVLAGQADRIVRAAEEAIPEPDDRRDVLGRHRAFVAAVALAGAGAPGPVPSTR